MVDSCKVWDMIIIYLNPTASGSWVFNLPDSVLLDLTNIE